MSKLRDPYRDIAAEVFNIEPAAVTTQQRHAAKMIAYGSTYGISAETLAARIHVSVAAVRVVSEAWTKLYPIKQELEAAAWRKLFPHSKH